MSGSESNNSDKKSNYNTNIKTEIEKYENVKIYEYGALYGDRLQLLAINNCLNLHSYYYKDLNYEDKYAQGELIDHRDKRIESCIDQVLNLHKAFNSAYYNFGINDNENNSLAKTNL